MNLDTPRLRDEFKWPPRRIRTPCIINISGGGGGGGGGRKRAVLAAEI